MHSKPDIVKVLMDNQPVGKLALTPDYLIAFEYEKSFLEAGFSISPFYLPLKPGVFLGKRDPFNGLFGVFNDSLPDGWGMLLTDRFLKKNQVNPEELTPLERLCLVGRSGMGALVYEPEYKFSAVEETNDLHQMAAEVERILNNEDSEIIDTLYRKGGSSGGARPKVFIRFQDNDWLVKFRAYHDPEDIGQSEVRYSQVARQCGIEMPETRLFEGKYFGVKRFDREGTTRFHVHSASGLLYASFRYPSLDYTELIKATLALTRNMDEALKVFRLMVFNVVTHNRDDHAKNFSFIYKEKSWQFAPAYDLVFSHGFNGNHTTTIAGQGKPTKKDVFEVARLTGLHEKAAKRIADEVYENALPIRKIAW